MDTSRLHAVKHLNMTWLLDGSTHGAFKFCRKTHRALQLVSSVWLSSCFRPAGLLALSMCRAPDHQAAAYSGVSRLCVPDLKPPRRSAREWSSDVNQACHRIGSKPRRVMECRPRIWRIVSSIEVCNRCMAAEETKGVGRDLWILPV